MVGAAQSEPVNARPRDRVDASPWSSYNSAGSTYFETPRGWSGTPNLYPNTRISGMSNICSNFSDGEITDDDKVSGISIRTTVSYARRRTLLRQKSQRRTKSSSRLTSLSVLKEAWSQKLNDYREFETGILKSLLPLKAAIAATLASGVCFAPFFPEQIRFYGAVAVMAVGMVLESNVGLTLMRGYNLLMGGVVAATCAFGVSLVEPFTGDYHFYFVLFCVFIGGAVPRMIKYPTLIKARWSHAVTFYIVLFHGLILAYPPRHSGEFFLNAATMTIGFLLACLLSLAVRPEFAGDALVALVVSDIHTAAVVLERIVGEYGSGTVLTKIQDVLGGNVTEDYIFHDLQFIIKSYPEVDKLMAGVPWEPCHGKFFYNYPWASYPKLMEKLLHVVYDIIALDSSLRAEIQAPVHVRQIFAEDMEETARECALLFHRMGDGLLEHKKYDYQPSFLKATAATHKLRAKLSMFSHSIITQNLFTRCPSHESSPEAEEVETKDMMEVNHDISESPKEEMLFEWMDYRREERPEISVSEEQRRSAFMQRSASLSRTWDETQHQMSTLSLIKFVSILIELMAKVKAVVKILDDFAVEAQFSVECA